MQDRSNSDRYNPLRILSPVHLPVPPPRPPQANMTGFEDAAPTLAGDVLPLNYVRIYSKMPAHDLNTRPSDLPSDALPTKAKPAHYYLIIPG